MNPYKTTQKDVDALTEAPIGINKGARYCPFAEFHSYVMGFYGKGGLYDINLTPDELMRATIERLKDDADLFEGDTVDREAIRDIVLANRQA